MRIKGGKVKVFDKEEDKAEVETLLKEKKPIVVLFYMEGCPHCEKNQDAWDKVETDEGVEKIEVEAIATPAVAKVDGFPTMKSIDEEGKEKSTTGAKEKPEEIEEELELKKEKKDKKKEKDEDEEKEGGRRKRRRSTKKLARGSSRRRRHHRLTRKSRR